MAKLHILEDIETIRTVGVQFDPNEYARVCPNTQLRVQDIVNRHPRSAIARSAATRPVVGTAVRDDPPAPVLGAAAPSALGIDVD